MFASNFLADQPSRARLAWENDKLHECWMAERDERERQERRAVRRAHKLERRNQHIQQLEHQVKEYGGHIQQLETQADEFETNATFVVDTQKQTITELMDKVAALTEDYEGCEAALTHVQDLYTDVSDKYQDVTATNRFYKVQLECVTDELDDLDKVCTALKVKLKHAQKDNERLHKVVEALQGEVSDLVNENDILDGENNTMLDDVAVMEAAIQTYKNVIVEYEKGVQMPSENKSESESESESEDPQLAGTVLDAVEAGIFEPETDDSNYAPSGSEESESESVSDSESVSEEYSSDFESDTEEESAKLIHVTQQSDEDEDEL